MTVWLLVVTLSSGQTMAYFWPTEARCHREGEYTVKVVNIMTRMTATYECKEETL